MNQFREGEVDIYKWFSKKMKSCANFRNSNFNKRRKIYRIFWKSRIMKIFLNLSFTYYKYFFLNSERFLLKLRTLIVAILSGLIFGNYLLYDFLNFMEQIEATSRYLEMSMKSHRGQRTTLSHSHFDFTMLAVHVHACVIVKDAEMQRRDAVRFASSFSRLLTAYILRTMLSEGKRILDSVSPAGIERGDGDGPRDSAGSLCTSATHRHSMRNYIQLLSDKPF